MKADDDLNRLAAIAGIEPRFWDIQGRLYQATPEIARAVLDTFGLPAGTDAEVERTLDRLHEETWDELMPPVVAARAFEEIDVPIHSPLSNGPGPLRWSVRLEYGEIRTGESDFNEMPVRQTDVYRGTPVVRRILTLAPLPAGYHEFRIENETGAYCHLIVAPSRCYMPPSVAGKRFWGAAAQLYALNSSRNWGIGDFGDLRALIELLAANGADAVGLNPLHALFLDAPEQASPYSPSSRLFRNPLYLDIAAIPDIQECDPARAFTSGPEIQRAIASARAAALIDYKAAAKLKLAVLERLHRSFRDRHVMPGTARGRAFVEFANRSGVALRRFAAFQALSEHFDSHDWRRWPTPFRICDSSEVDAFQRDHEHRISFFIYLQWLCENQVLQAAEDARAREMAIGLYNDFAVGVDAAGFDHWAHRDLYAGRLRIGAPPDPFNERGQEWGVVPLNPRRIRRDAYEHFKAALRANMRHAGALRIDHVIGWRRLFVIPDGASPENGVYVNYPLNDLLAVASLESHRSRCIVIGEDLGTVPEGFRERMAAENILSCRLLYFEKDHQRYHPLEDYPALAAAAASTHDLATLRGFWCGDDITVKSTAGTFPSPESEDAARNARTEDKRRLLQALADADLLPEGLSVTGSDRVEWSSDLACAIHTFLARTPSLLVMVQLDDLVNELHQANLPGSTTEYPNWRRKLSRTLNEIGADAGIKDQMAAIDAARRGLQSITR